MPSMPTPSFAAIFGGWVKQERKARGMPQKILSSQSGLQQGTISDVEHATKGITDETIDKILDGFGMSVREMLRSDSLVTTATKTLQELPAGKPRKSRKEVRVTLHPRVSGLRAARERQKTKEPTPARPAPARKVP